MLMQRRAQAQDKPEKSLAADPQASHSQVGGMLANRQDVSDDWKGLFDRMDKMQADIAEIKGNQAPTSSWARCLGCFAQY